MKTKIKSVNVQVQIMEGDGGWFWNASGPIPYSSRRRAAEAAARQTELEGEE